MELTSLGSFWVASRGTLATLSVLKTPFRSFSEGPGTLVMGTLPWILVPAMLVPVGFLVHVVIMAKLRTVSQAVGAMAVAG
jgi:Na+/pantothenate symporter